MCSHVTDFNAQNKNLTAKLLQQGYRFHKLRKTCSKVYRRHFELVSKFNVDLKTFLRHGLSKPEFYGDLVYKFKKIECRTDFSATFQTTSYLLQFKCDAQSACLVFNPITVNNYASFFI